MAAINPKLTRFSFDWTAKKSVNIFVEMNFKGRRFENPPHLGTAQSLFKREEKSGEKIYSKQEKLEVLGRLENKSKSEAEKIAFPLVSTPITTIEKIKPISYEDVEIRFTAKEELVKKLQKLKALFAHKNPNIPLSELIDYLCDLGLEKWDNPKPRQRGTLSVNLLHNSEELFPFMHLASQKWRSIWTLR